MCILAGIMRESASRRHMIIHSVIFIIFTTFYVTLAYIPTSIYNNFARISTSNYKFNTRYNVDIICRRLSTPFIEAEGSGSPCRIKVIGVGGGGGNAVNRMMESSTGVLGVELWAVNTDAQALSRSLAPKKLNIGTTTSR
jgi:hypothetical protein